MNDFLIDLPYHKRWWLPDHIHQINASIFGDTENLAVINGQTFSARESITLKLDHNWKANRELFITLAEKKYRKTSRKETNAQEYLRSYRR